MLRKRFFTAPAAALVALVLGLGGALVSTTAASAHTPRVTTDCQTLTVNLTQYADQKAAVPGTSTTTYQRYSWTGGNTETAPTEVPPSSNWQANTSNYKGELPLDVAFQEANGSNSSWFFWDSTVTTTPGTPATTNTVTVTIDGVVVERADFGKSFAKSYTYGDKYVAHSYSVAIIAHDDPTGSRGWTKTFTGTSTPCARPDVTVPVQLTYMTACAVDTTNTWRFRNPTSTPVTLSLSDGATHVATPGDSIYETPRSSTTLTATWGGPGTGVVAGSTVKASGVDEISDACAGPKPETKVENGQWSVVSTDCETRTITETRTVTTTTYARVGNQWVGTPTTSSETVTRDMTVEELDEYCPVDEQPDALVVRGEWMVGEPDCDSRTVTETRTITRTEFVLVDREWVPGEPVVTERERTRDMTVAELDEYCPVDEQPDALVVRGEWMVGEPDCDSRTVTETRTITRTEFVLVDREWVPGEPVVTERERTRDMTVEELDEYCPVDIEPAALEVLGDWVVSSADCDTREVTETRTVTTTPYVLVDREWVPGESVVDTEERTRPMTEAELDEYCPVDLEPAALEVVGDWMFSGKDCDTTTITESRTVSTTPYVLVDREWVAGSAVETTELRTRAMTDAERTALCPAVPVTPLGELPTLALNDPSTLALTGPSAALGGLGIAGLVALMAGLGLVLLRRPQPVSEEN
ncbi:hypothetical protein OVN18_05135 [Microcella daejeonensis]|uniref:Uncharacterized protein n=1 Tax=Microcella daejeonensis TaxID=2994971 RepID=A0A9E8MMI2_9MICO|nr:hypothetical protein [Microcella daejeonensis]WAB82389.1 hypothetical protein OVN18_05135 [Microcella daejeonensis]